MKPLPYCPGFRCTSSSRLCIPKKWVCNGFTDCLEAEDEYNCSVDLVPQLYDFYLKKFKSSEDSQIFDAEKDANIQMVQNFKANKEFLPFPQAAKKVDVSTNINENLGDLKQTEIKNVFQGGDSNVNDSQPSLTSLKPSVAIDPTSEKGIPKCIIEKKVDETKVTFTPNVRDSLDYETKNNTKSSEVLGSKEKESEFKVFNSKESSNREKDYIFQYTSVESTKSSDSDFKHSSGIFTRSTTAQFNEFSGEKMKNNTNKYEFPHNIPTPVEVLEVFENHIEITENPFQNTKTYQEKTTKNNFKASDIFVSEKHHISVEESGLTGDYISEYSSFEEGTSRTIYPFIKELNTWHNNDETSGSSKDDQKFQSHITVGLLQSETTETTTELNYGRYSEETTISNLYTPVSIETLSLDDEQQATLNAPTTNIPPKIEKLEFEEDALTSTAPLQILTENINSANPTDLGSSEYKIRTLEVLDTLSNGASEPFMSISEFEGNTAETITEPNELMKETQTTTPNEPVTYSSEFEEKAAKTIDVNDEPVTETKTITSTEYFISTSEIKVENTEPNAVKKRPVTETLSALSNKSTQSNIEEHISEATSPIEMFTKHIQSITPGKIGKAKLNFHSEEKMTEQSTTRSWAQENQGDGVQYFKCRYIVQSILKSYRCDGVRDCEDGSDEQNCSCLNFLTNENSKLICNGHFDCNDGSDEKNCGKCPKNSFQCETSGECKRTRERCDGVPNCAFGEDEKYCFALSDTKDIKLDINGNPLLQVEGLVVANKHSIWSIACQKKGFIFNGTLASEVCSNLGLIGYEKYDNETVSPKCTGLRVTCSKGLSTSIDLYRSSKGYMWPWNAFVYTDGELSCSATLLEPSWLISSSNCMRNFT